MAHGGYKREVRGRGLESRGVAQAERWDSRTQLDYGPPLGEMSACVRHRSARCCDPVRIQARQELLLACDVRAAQGGRRPRAPNGLAAARLQTKPNGNQGGCGVCIRERHGNSLPRGTGKRISRHIAPVQGLLGLGAELVLSWTSS